MNALRFTAYGVPQPQGSAKGFIPRGWKRPIITSDNPKNKGWRQVVAEAANTAIAQTPGFRLIESAAELTVRFYFPRPKAIRDKRVPHTKKPDCDKAVRSVCDALTKVVIADDSLITKILAMKFYAEPGEPPRAEISITALHPDALLSFSSAEPNLLANGGSLL